MEWVSFLLAFRWGVWQRIEAGSITHMKKSLLTTTASEHERTQQRVVKTMVEIIQDWAEMARLKSSNAIKPHQNRHQIPAQNRKPTSNSWEWKPRQNPWTSWTRRVRTIIVRIETLRQKYVPHCGTHFVEEPLRLEVAGDWIKKSSVPPLKHTKCGCNWTIKHRVLHPYSKPDSNSQNSY